MKPLTRIEAVPLIADVQDELITLLEGLSPEEWSAPTRSAAWNVKDVVAHLLDGDVRRLSLHRDRLSLPDAPEPAGDHGSLVAYLDELNEAWVTAARRMSPRLLVEMTAFTTPRVVEHLRALDPGGTARFAVAWAGEEASENWFDVAREYTEKWHHQQQIREAVGRPLLTGRKWLRPLVATLVRGMPAVFDRHASGVAPTRVEIAVGGAVGQRWLLTNEDGAWELFESEDDPSDTRIVLDDATAWHLFAKWITAREAFERMEVSGDRELARVLARTVSFMK